MNPDTLKKLKMNKGGIYDIARVYDENNIPIEF